jgi:hypothetical protein
MATSKVTQTTDFTRDIIGRYVCNGLDEALLSTDTSRFPDARPFDIIILGGGSFGAVLADHVFHRDQARAHRILVLEAGPMALPEHFQNLPPRLDTGEVWGVPWNSDSPRSWNRQFPGLAFCVGGRSVFWGGWSPYFIDSELPTPPWPASVKHDLTQPVLRVGTRMLSYLDLAAAQIGSDTDNDFVNGALHETLRGQLFNGLQARSPGSNPVLTGNRGDLLSVADLEAPLAVQSASPRPGFFPFNKFNGVQLLMRATRMAQSEAEQTAVGSPEALNVKKRLMVVPNAHVIRLESSGGRITRIFTNRFEANGGVVDVVPGAKVFLALGTIENTRLALETLPNANRLMGRNLMAHLRSNVTIRIPRTSYAAALDPAVHPELRELSVSALFVKGVHQHDDSTLGHFHVQITASGVGNLETNSEAELFKKVPDVDTLDAFQDLTDQQIVLTLRGIGEMVGDKTSPDPLNRIIVDTLGPQGPFDYQQSRALVRLEAGPANSKNLRLWDAMDRACDELALIFANGGPIQYLSNQTGGVWQHTPPATDARRDTLSSTHHESGTLWLGDDSSTSVCDGWGLIRESANLYVLGPALLPTMGSPNPMLSGVALTRRTGDHVIAVPAPPALEPGYRYLFDGTGRAFNGWLFAGGGTFALVDGNLVTQVGNEIGLLYYALEQFGDFTLRLQYFSPQPFGNGNDNSGVFVRFRDPRKAVPRRNDPTISDVYINQAFVGVDTGFEVQIDEEARGNKSLNPPEDDGWDHSRTGAIYKIPTGQTMGSVTEPKEQNYHRGQIRVNDWNDLEVQVAGDVYTVKLNGQVTSTFTNHDAYRGKSPAQDPESGFIGLQVHTGRVAFRNIRVFTAVPAAVVPPALAARMAGSAVARVNGPEVPASAGSSPESDH